MDSLDNLPVKFVPVQEGPGRPKRGNVDVLRTQLWVWIILLRSGWTIYRLEREFHPEQVKQQAGKISRPKRWDRYWDGRMALADRPGPTNLIDRVEARFPGTARWFRHPIWAALTAEQLSEDDILMALRQLERRVQRRVLTNRELDGRRRRGRRPTFPPASQFRLIQRGSFDALAAAVLMVRLSEVRSLSELRRQALNVYYALQPKIAAHPYLRTFYPRLFSLVDFSCRQWITFEADPAVRLDAIVCWQGIQAHVWGEPRQPWPEILQSIRDQQTQA